MSPEQIERARRWVALSKWQWMAGMLTYFDDSGDRVVAAAANRCLLATNNEWVKMRTLKYDPLPDLTDPATVGCLLELVQKHYSKCAISLLYPTGLGSDEDKGEKC